MRAERRAQARANTREMLEMYNAAARQAAERGTGQDLAARDLAMNRLRLAASGVSRRAVLKGAGLSAAAAALAGTPLLRPAAARAAGQPRIVIAGAGAAGIRCAHKLWTHSGWTSTVYEWDDHAGGRIETLRGFFDNGQIAEMHGEFVSSEHASMLALASSFSLGLDDTLAYPGGIVNTYWFNGSRYTQAQLDADWQATYWSVFHNAVKTATWPQSYNKITATAKSWDAMSVPEWIDANLPGGTGTAFGGLCLQDVISEYGGDPADQSALNLPFILGYDDSAGGKGIQPKNSPVLAGTDERWHITGGNDQIITGMLSQLPAGTVQYGQQLVAVVKSSDGTFTGTFSSGQSTTQVTVDRFIFALPFSTLRNVDLSKAGLSALKKTAIDELGYGTNGKIIVQTNGHPWVTDGYNGTFFTDNGADGGWEVNYQANNYSAATGVLLAFPGGAQGSALQARYGLTFGTDEGPAPAQMVTDYLGHFETLLPGVTAAYNGKAYYNIGLLDPHILGAWSYWRIGQYGLFSGYEGVAEGNAHFCGEHTAQNFQGFMEGAVTSGERVAGEV